MFCSNCGSDIRGDAAFCPQCGTKIVHSENQIESEFPEMSTPEVAQAPKASTAVAEKVDSFSLKRFLPLVLIGLALIALVVGLGKCAPSLSGSIDSTSHAGKQDPLIGEAENAVTNLLDAIKKQDQNTISSVYAGNADDLLLYYSDLSTSSLDSLLAIGISQAESSVDGVDAVKEQLKNTLLSFEYSNVIAHRHGDGVEGSQHYTVRVQLKTCNIAQMESLAAQDAENAAGVTGFLGGAGALINGLFGDGYDVGDALSDGLDIYQNVSEAEVAAFYGRLSQELQSAEIVNSGRGWYVYFDVWKAGGYWRIKPFTPVEKYYLWGGYSTKGGSIKEAFMQYDSGNYPIRLDRIPSDSEAEWLRGNLTKDKGLVTIETANEKLAGSTEVNGSGIRWSDFELSHSEEGYYVITGKVENTGEESEFNEKNSTRDVSFGFLAKTIDEESKEEAEDYIENFYTDTPGVFVSYRQSELLYGACITPVALGGTSADDEDSNTDLSYGYEYSDAEQLLNELAFYYGVNHPGIIYGLESGEVREIKLYLPASYNYYTNPITSLQVEPGSPYDSFSKDDEVPYFMHGYTPEDSPVQIELTDQWFDIYVTSDEGTCSEMYVVRGSATNTSDKTVTASVVLGAYALDGAPAIFPNVHTEGDYKFLDKLEPGESKEFTCFMEGNRIRCFEIDHADLLGVFVGKYHEPEDKSENLDISDNESMDGYNTISETVQDESVTTESEDPYSLLEVTNMSVQTDSYGRYFISGTITNNSNNIYTAVCTLNAIQESKDKYDEIIYTEVNRFTLSGATPGVLGDSSHTRSIFFYYLQPGEARDFIVYPNEFNSEDTIIAEVSCTIDDIIDSSLLDSGFGQEYNHFDALSVSDFAISEDGTLSGTLTNNTNLYLDSATILVLLKDENGELAVLDSRGTRPAGISVAYVAVEALGPGVTKAFEYETDPKYKGAQVLTIAYIPDEEKNATFASQ